MLNELGVIDINSEINNLKTTYKNNSKDKVNYDFKDYLTSEVNNTSKEKVKITDDSKKTINEDHDYIKNDVVNKETLKEISEKIEYLLQDEDINIENLNENLQEIILLLLNVLQTNSKDFNDVNIEEISNLDALDIINNEEFNLIETNSSLQDINNLLIEYLQNENLNEVSLNNINNGDFDEISELLFDEMKELLSSIPKDVIKEVNNKLESNDSKLILNYLISEINKKDDENSSNKLISSFNEVEAMLSEEDSINIDSEKNISNNNFNVKENGSSKEDDILKKILESEDNQSFSKTLNYYTKLNNSNVITQAVNEPVVINKDNINVDFIKNIKYMINNSMEELSVKIYPKELGEITIKLISEAGIMKAEIKATSKETYNLLNSNLNEIKNSLENQNIKIQEVNIGIYNEDTTFFSGEENSRKFYETKNINKVNTNASIEEEEIITDILNEGNINFLA